MYVLPDQNQPFNPAHGPKACTQPRSQAHVFEDAAVVNFLCGESQEKASGGFPSLQAAPPAHKVSLCKGIHPLKAVLIADTQPHAPTSRSIWLIILSRQAWFCKLLFLA